MPEFKLVSDFKPTGDQPQAIAQLVEGINKGYKHQTLLGATGTGKTYVMQPGHRAGAEAHPRPGAQQDAGRPALRRVQGVLPQQRGRVLRLLLRLLPAGSLHSAATTSTSRRTPTSTKRSTGCASRPRPPCSPAGT